MKKANLYLVKVLKALEQKINNEESIAKKSAESIYKIESAIERKANEKSLSLRFQRFVGLASIILAVVAAGLSGWSIYITIQNRKIKTTIDKMEDLLMKQDTQIVELKKLAINSDTQVNRLQDLIIQNSDLVTSAQSQVGISSKNLIVNNELLGLQVNDQNKVLQSSFFELVKMFNDFEIPNLTKRYFSTGLGPSNKTMYDLVVSFLTILETGKSNRYLLYDISCETKWNKLHETCTQLKKNINVLEEYNPPGYTGDNPPDDYQRGKYRSLVAGQKMEFINQYEDLKKYLESVKVKMPSQK